MFSLNFVEQFAFNLCSDLNFSDEDTEGMVLTSTVVKKDQRRKIAFDPEIPLKGITNQKRNKDICLRILSSS